MDWSDGTYELTARRLEPAAGRVVEAARVGERTTVVDVGCGTGNASILAARRGARVAGVDPAARLLEVARARAQSENLQAHFVSGSADAIPVADGSQEVVISVFAVIFAPDAHASASEMARVLRPDGRLVMTSWIDEGAIATAGRILMTAASGVKPPGAERATPRWGDPDFVRDLFAPHGLHTSFERHSVSFTAASPEAWFDEQERHHPVWRFVRAKMADAGDEAAWTDVRGRTIEALSEHNEDPSAFRVDSPYWVISASRAGAAGKT